MEDFFDKWDEAYEPYDEELVIEELEDYLRRASLAGEGILPRWAV